MLPILTPAEAAALDRAAVEGGMTVLDLMENAGRAVAKAAVELAGGAYGRRAAVVCGKGNNGGDGLVAARHALRAGMGVVALLLADPAELASPAAENLKRFDRAGGRWRRAEPASDGEGGALRREIGRADVVIDAIFGTGFRGTPEGSVAEAIHTVNDSTGPILAVDIPSGVEGESGAVRGASVNADATVTFGALKPGVVFYPGASNAGEVIVADIGYPNELVRSDLLLVEARDAAPAAGDPQIHKRSRGTVLVFAGSRRMTGAAVLAASAAYRAGAGLVILAAPAGIVPVLQGVVTEALFLPLPETPEGSASESALAELLERSREAHSIAIGPGLSGHPETAELVRRLAAEAPVPLVLDADGLGAFAGRSVELAERRSPAVLTPHTGEFARLMGLGAQEIGEDRLGLARKAAVELRCTVLLKGPPTLVADPGGVVHVNPTGGPSLATGGTGDVLTGMVAAFMARARGEPTRSAYSAAFAHGLAGDLAAHASGQGVVASDLIRFVPEAVFGSPESRPRPHLGGPPAPA